MIANQSTVGWLNGAFWLDKSYWVLPLVQSEWEFVISAHPYPVWDLSTYDYVKMTGLQLHRERNLGYKNEENDFLDLRTVKIYWIPERGEYEKEIPWLSKSLRKGKGRFLMSISLRCVKYVDVAMHSDVRNWGELVE